MKTLPGRRRNGLGSCQRQDGRAEMKKKPRNNMLKTFSLSERERHPSRKIKMNGRGSPMEWSKVAVEEI